ncbi:hypothetical protein SCUP234_04635 [Seiridium cupressi]
MFSRGVSLTLEDSQNSILEIEHYNAQKVWDFIEDAHAKVLTEWGGYLERRKQGGGPELFATVEAAKTWLVQQAPVKFVDGAWLAHIHKITTPFALRTVTKDVWQVFSEELGDGDLSKHHVYLYQKLLENIGCTLPEGHSADFIDARHWDGVDNHDAWEAAVGQLLISLFPHEFLPEILGFNMHYELVTLDTMRAAHELRTLGINPYYFLIHIAIDNADSGHTAMATHTVTRYLDMVRETEGETALEQAWKRVQVGYMLSQTLGHTLSRDKEEPSASAIKNPGFTNPNIPLDPLSARVIDIFRAKASTSQRFHCQSRARIGAHTLSEWLDPSIWKHPNLQHQVKLLTALSQAKPWIFPGASSKSLLVRELLWEGRMFGAFTHDEVAALSAWIDALGPENMTSLYWRFTRREPVSSKDVVGELTDPSCHHPFVLPSDTAETGIGALATGNTDFDLDFEPWEKQQQPLSSDPLKAHMPDVVALWFAHLGLLENTVNIPSRTACPLYGQILRLLRAQTGFAVEMHIIAGMDEMKRQSCPNLVDIGLELIQRAEWTSATTAKSPSCLKDVFVMTARQGQNDVSAGLADDMLRWSARPTANLGLLLGLSLAFLQLKQAVRSAQGLLSQESVLVLEAIVGREKGCLDECVAELRRTDEMQYKNLVRGYLFGIKILESIL